MAKEEVGTETLKDLVGSVRDLAAAAQRTKGSTLSAYLEKNKRKVKLKQPFHQNGVLIRIDQLTDEQVELVNQLKPGRYNSRKWEIVKRRDRSIDFRYPNKTIEHRMQTASQAGDLTGMLKMILTEAETIKARRKAGEDVDDDY
jgi:hypothetical protein